MTEAQLETLVNKAIRAGRQGMQFVDIQRSNTIQGKSKHEP